MSGKDVMKKVADQIQENEQLSHARRIMASIIVKLEIREGIGLPNLLGQPQAKNNQEAILYFIIEEVLTG